MCLWTLGSVRACVRARDFVWGVGAKRSAERANPAVCGPSDITREHVYALRGPFTADALGLHDVPLGDPAILLAMLRDHLDLPPTKSILRPRCVVPWNAEKHAHIEQEAAAAGATVQWPNIHWQEMAVFLQGCGAVACSSLHCLIMADAFRVPNQWFQYAESPTAGEGFKYADYLSTVGRATTPFASIEAALRAAKPVQITFNYSSLVHAFPYHLFKLQATARPVVDRARHALAAKAVPGKKKSAAPNKPVKQNEACVLISADLLVPQAVVC